LYFGLISLFISEEQAEDVFKLIERLEQDDDVQRVFHNMG
jgi:transcriptional/translational regulatory protein YebC/TACO1